MKQIGWAILFLIVVILSYYYGREVGAKLGAEVATVGVENLLNICDEILDETESSGNPDSARLRAQEKWAASLNTLIHDRWVNRRHGTTRLLMTEFRILQLSTNRGEADVSNVVNSAISNYSIAFQKPWRAQTNSASVIDVIKPLHDRLYAK